MWRHAHRWPAIVLGILLVVLSITGAALAVDPVLKRFDRYVTPLGETTLGDVLRISAKKAPHFQLDRVRIDYSGRVMVRGADMRGSREVPLNLETQRLGRVDRPSDFMELMRRLHTTLNIGPQMRPVVFVTVATMVVLLVSGAVLLVHRIGSLRQTVTFSRVRGRGLSKWHSVVGRLLVIPLFVTAFSGLWMSAVTLELLPAAGATEIPESARPDPMPEEVKATDFAIWDTIPLSELTEITFPIASDWWDVYVLRTGGQLTYIDQFTGAVIAQGPVSFWVRALDLFTMLHTGRGAVVWGAAAGLFALSVPFFAITGVWLWLSRRQRSPHVPGLVRPSAAQTAILVGSESGSTWGYATHLAQQLIAAGRRVSLSGMNKVRDLDADAQILVLTATYGDGTAPAGAAQFLPRLPRLKGGRDFAVLGFGDTSFPAYCRFAHDCHEALKTSRQPLLDMQDVNRGSPQAFAAWGREIGPALGVPDLSLTHEPVRPKTRPMALLERTDFATDGQGRAAILRFDARGLKRFDAGDLLSVYPKGDNVARLYSLASSSRDKVVELCVVRVAGGLCSNQLLDLQIGETADVVVTPNPDFRAPRRRPCLMIAAGTGIAPFAGMIRANRRAPMDLYFGLRHPDQDFYYQDEIARWQQQGRLARFRPAFSRYGDKTYVQDLLAAEADHVAARLAAGASVMVCGSVAMGRAVAEVIDTIAATRGGSLERLRAQGRYLEDVY